MIQEMYRTEGVHGVLARGMRVDWERDQIHAHGSAGQMNPVGNALNHMIVHPNRENAMVVINAVAKSLVKLGICSEKECVDYANEAAKYWWNPRCHTCGGTGVLNKEQDECPTCKGERLRPIHGDEKLRQAIGSVMTYAEWMEMQLRRRLA